MGTFWSQPLRVECADKIQLITSRTLNSRLWFVNDRRLERRILGYLAKYAKKYEVLLYAFVLVGNHYHLLAKFPKGHRSEFIRDFNARFAEAVRHLVPDFLGGSLFHRRFTPQILPLNEDVLKYFFYCALQPVSSGLTEKLSDYDSYNSFSAAAGGKQQTFKLFNYGKFNAAKRNNANVKREDFVEEHTLKFEQLPGMENLSASEYKKALLKQLEEKRLDLVNDRRARKKEFFGRENLRKVIPGSLPKNTKSGGMRPIVLSCSREAKNQVLSWYFSIVEAYKKAVSKYRAGDLSTEFPPGTFRPPGIALKPT